MAGAEVQHRADVDHLRARRRQPSYLARRERGEDVALDQGRATTVHLTEPEEVRREGAQRVQQLLTNASSDSARSRLLVARSLPILDVRSAPGGAEQKEPAP
jgi:hypothetical protein